MVILEDEPVISPGLIVQVSEGKPLNTTLPVPEIQVAWVMVPTTGAAGGFTQPHDTENADPVVEHPEEFLTVML